MLAILVATGTKYACNFSFDRDHMCLQSRKFLKHLESDRLGYLKNSRLQAYMVPILTDIAGTIAPPYITAGYQPVRSFG